MFCFVVFYPFKSLFSKEAEKTEKEYSTHVISIEFLGHNNISLFSTHFTYIPNFFAYRIGIASTANIIGIPLLFSFLIGSDNHKFEVGLGIISNIPLESTSSSKPILGTALLGYRYLPDKTGFSFNIGFTPYILSTPVSSSTSDYTRWFLPYYGIGVGYAF